MVFLLGLIVVSYFIFILVRYYRNLCDVKKKLRHVPSPPGLPFMGHVLYFKEPKEILQVLTEISHRHDGFFKVHFFGSYTIFVSDVMKAEKVLSSTKMLHKSFEYNHFNRWLGSGLLTCAPWKWRKTRKIITPTFHFQILEQFIETYNSASNILVEKLVRRADGTNFDVFPYVTLCTLDIICETAMGTSVNAQHHSDSDYVKAVQEMSRIIRTRLFSPIKRHDFPYYFSSDYRAEKNALKTLHGYTTSVIETRKKEVVKKSSDPQIQNGKRRLAFLDLLLQYEADGEALTTDEIREEVDTFMFEGHDTTACAIAFTIYCLSQNHEIQNMAVKELQEVLKHDSNGKITFSNLQQMKYLEMVIKESLRLFPSVPLFGRQLQEDAEFDGEILPKGVTITVFPYGMHRNPVLYPDPETFDPERFNTDAQKNREPFAYIPFSAGPRNCIGQKFAMLEMKTTLSNILRNFEILPAENYTPVLVPNVILKSLNGVEICLKERFF